MLTFMKILTTIIHLAAEDVNFIRTPEVLAHRITRFIAYVDIVDHSKGRSQGE